MAEKDDYLADILVDLGFVSPEQVAALRTEASAAGVGVVDLMVANKVVRPADVTQGWYVIDADGCVLREAGMHLEPLGQGDLLARDAELLHRGARLLQALDGRVEQTRVIATFLTLPFASRSIVAWPTCSCSRLPFRCAFLASQHNPSFRTPARS